MQNKSEAFTSHNALFCVQAIIVVTMYYGRMHCYNIVLLACVF